MNYINKAKRRFLLTGHLEKPAYGAYFGPRSSRAFMGGRWALQHHARGQTPAQVYFFHDETHRARWIALNPGRRQAVGKRHPAVKAFRNDMQRPKPHEAIASY